MNAKLIYRIQLVIVAVLVITFGYSVISTNKKISSGISELQNLKAKSIALDDKVQGLTSAKQDITKYAEISRIARAVVPADKNQAQAVREIVNIAASNGIGIGSITFPASSLGAYTNTTGSPVPGSKSALSQLKPVANIPGVYQLTINVSGDPTKPVAYDKFVNFLSGLERNRRTAQVTSVSINPSGDKPSDITFNLSLNEYIKP